MDDKAAIVTIASLLAKNDGPGTARMMDAFLADNQGFDPAESGYAPADGVSPDTALALMEIARECWYYVYTHSGPVISYAAAGITIFDKVWPLISSKSDFSEDETKEKISEGLKKASDLKPTLNESGS